MSPARAKHDPIAAALSRRRDWLKHPWEMTSTVWPDRRNIFCTVPGHSGHICTLTAGSRSQLAEFEECARVMGAASILLSAAKRIAASMIEHGTESKDTAAWDALQDAIANAEGAA